VWKIRNFPGGKEFLLRAKFGLPSVAAEDEQTGRMPPIRVNYEVSALSVYIECIAFPTISSTFQAFLVGLQVCPVYN
jgi:hypothetical protein